MAKYIIDVPDDTKWIEAYYAVDHLQYQGKTIMVDSLIPYTEPDREAIENKVRVGDEIVSELTKIKGVITAIDAWDGWHCVSENGRIVDITTDKCKYWKKTGRHFPEVAELLTKMREE